MSDAPEPFNTTSIIIDRYKLRNPSHVPMLPAVFMAPVGKVAVAWGFFEAAFDRLLAALAAAEGLPDDDWRGFSFRRRRKVFTKLMGHALNDCPSVIRLAAEIANDSQGAYSKRNLVVHGQLSIGFSVEGGAQVVRLVCVGRANRQEVRGDFTVDELDDLFYEIAHLSGRVHALASAEVGQPPSSPETQKLRALLVGHPLHPTLPKPLCRPGS
jgi:hypothetical protein